MNAIKSDGLAGRFSKFISNNPKKSILVGLALFFGLAPGAQYLQTDFSYRIWFREADPLLVKFDAFERKFGNDDQALLAVHSPSGVFDPETAKLVQELTEKMWLAPEVIRVDSLANYNWVHAKGDEILVDPFLPDDVELTPEFLQKRKEIALADETIPNYLVSEDGKTALIYATVQPKLEGTADYKTIVEYIHKEIEQYKGKGDHEFYISGNVGLSDGFRESTEIDMSRLMPFVLLVTIIFLALSFKSVLGVVLSLVVIFATIAATMGTYGYFGIKFNNLTSIVPQVLVAVAVADSVHILVSYFRGLQAGLTRKEASEYTLIKNFLPTILTTLSTAVGFFAFSSAKIVPIAQMGIGAGIGTIYAWFMTYFLLGPLMVMLPITGSKKAKPKTKPKEASEFSKRMAALIEKRSVPILIFGALTVSAGLILTSQNVVNSDPFKYFAPKFHLSIANNFIEEQVGGGMGVELEIDAGGTDAIKDPAFLAKVDQLQQWIQKKEFVTKTISVVDILKSMNRSLHGDQQSYYRIPESKEAVAQLLFLYSMSLPQGMDINNRVTIDNDQTRLTALWTLHDSATCLAVMDEIEAKGKEMGLNVAVTGKMPLYQKMNGYVVGTFVTSMSLAVILISLLMALVLKSFKLGMIAMIPNLMPLVAGGAIVRLLGLNVDIGTVIVGSVCLGIAVDDTIHFLSNYNRLTREGYSPRDAVAEVFTHTAPALTVTTIVLVASFGTFVFATFVPNYNFGRLVASVLTFALAADFIILPALLIRLKVGATKKEAPVAPVPEGAQA